MITPYSAVADTPQSREKPTLWVMGGYEHGVLCLFLIEAYTELEAHYKAGMILRKRQNLWYEALEPLSQIFEIYPEEQINNERTSLTICPPNYYS